MVQLAPLSEGMSSEVNLRDRVALVTGAARGIGRAIAETLAKAGADVAVLDLQSPDEAAAAIIGGAVSATASTQNPAGTQRTGKPASRSGPAYALAKGGVIAFTKWVAKDAGRHGIHVNAICPGPIESER